ncbi:hypothetical protein GIB67_016626 [Kingdonia uniflora]|uniref:Uncharacterized protein n=1 Tax=Kingdonia uniflora TaxID=39325 RepID=A0A7J7MZJ1_9MAGN|nr:hypothetical protein GIB67_016626 [Kingdonia uniflora]
MGKSYSYKGIGDLKELRSLNLSSNLLIGPFPESFQYLESIESLIPPWENIPPQIVRLGHLATFSVAFNNLSGSLPELKSQFGTFTESSYIGNPGLCGKPLKRSCSDDSQPQQNDNDADESKIIDSNVLFYIFLTISYAVGFWVVIGPLLFVKRWKEKYFGIMDVYIDWFSERMLIKVPMLVQNRRAAEE